MLDRHTAKRIRVLAGVSQERLAAELHVSRGAIARWESGVRRPRAENRKRYMALLRELRRAIA